MRASSLSSTIALICLATASAPQAATREADFKAALTAAEAAEQDALALKNRWTTTEDALAAAKKAAAVGDFEAAVSEAKRAEALAKASIAQAKEQETAWRAAVTR
ncbi:MAG TPA: hypothetical protein VGJ20_08575 [Xanthobacteraceae bacterium]